MSTEVYSEVGWKWKKGILLNDKQCNMVQTRKVGLLPDLYLHKEHEWVILFIQYILLSEQHSENFDENLIFWDK